MFIGNLRFLIAYISIFSGPSVLWLHADGHQASREDDTSAKPVLVEVDRDVTRGAAAEQLLKKLEERGFMLHPDVTSALVVLTDHAYIPGTIDPAREKDIRVVEGVIAVWEDAAALRASRRIRSNKKSRVQGFRYSHPAVTFKLKDGACLHDVISGLAGIVDADRLFPWTTDPELASICIVRVLARAEACIRKSFASSPFVEYVDPPLSQRWIRPVRPSRHEET